MPVKAPSACRRPGCAGLVRDGVCNRCGPLRKANDAQLDQRRGTSGERGYDARWQHLRDMFLRAHPLCIECQHEGRVTPAEDIDHIVPIADGGARLDERNLQALCRAHHNQKTRQDVRRRQQSEGNVASVIVVAGAPGSGKTTFVRERMKEGDLVVDLDAITAALNLGQWYEKTPGVFHVALDVRDFLLRRILQPSEIRTAWVITSEADAAERADLAERLKAVRVIVLETSAGECIRRITADPRRSQLSAQWGAIVQQWWSTYRPNPGEETC